MSFSANLAMESTGASAVVRKGFATGAKNICKILPQGQFRYWEGVLSLNEPNYPINLDTMSSFPPEKNLIIQRTMEQQKWKSPYFVSGYRLKKEGLERLLQHKPEAKTIKDISICGEAVWNLDCFETVEGRAKRLWEDFLLAHPFPNSAPPVQDEIGFQTHYVFDSVRWEWIKRSFYCKLLSDHMQQYEFAHPYWVVSRCVHGYRLPLRLAEGSTAGAIPDQLLFLPGDGGLYNLDDLTGNGGELDPLLQSWIERAKESFTQEVENLTAKLREDANAVVGGEVGQDEIL